MQNVLKAANNTETSRIYLQAPQGIMLQLFVLKIITICIFITNVDSGVPIGKCGLKKYLV